MKRFISTILTALCILHLSLLANAQILTNTNKGSFDKPNFNYPQTVISNADAQLSKALDSGDGTTVVLALIQSSLAKSIISSDSLPVIIDKIDNIAYVENNKCIKGTLHLLEAMIINNYYLNNKRKITNRTAITSNSSSFFEWNEAEFKAHISRLIDMALSEKDALKSAKITDYTDMVIISKEATAIYPTMYDFIAYECIDIYSSWSATTFYNPFAKSSLSADYMHLVQGIFDGLLSSYDKGTLPYIVACVSKIDFDYYCSSFNNAVQDEYHKLYNTYKNSEYIAPAIIRLEDDKTVLYQIYSDYLTSYPKSIYAPEIERRKLLLEERNATLRINHYFTSVDSIKVECQVTNVHNLELAIYPAAGKNYIQDIEKANVKPVFTHRLSVEGKVPFFDTITVQLPPLDYGQYTIVANCINTNGKKEKVSNTRYLDVFTVTDLTSFSILDIKNGVRKIFAVNAITGAPVKGVVISSNSQSKNVTPFSATTGKDGSVTIPLNSSYQQFSFANNNDRSYSWNYYNYYNNSDIVTEDNCNIFTDLAIYRPDDTIKMVASCYTAGLTGNYASQHKEFKVLFVDANYDSISSATLISDEMGRITHDFIVPVNRMNGEYTIIVKDLNNKHLSSSRVTVSEYKTPSFYIEFIDEKASYPESGYITICGEVKTFSGIPLGDTEVSCQLQSASWWNDFSSLGTTSISTDEMGRFTAIFDASRVNKDSKSYYRYRLVATVTDKAGETQSANSTPFTIGKSLILRWNTSNDINLDATQKVSLPVTLISNEENAPAGYPCILSLCDDKGNIVAKIPFESHNPIVSLSHIPSGKYKMTICLAADSSMCITDKYMVLYRPSDSCPPVNSALWTPITQQEVSPGKDGSILIGSSFKNSHIYYTISYLDKVLKSGWLTISKGLSRFRYTMPNDMLAGENIIINFYNAHNGNKMSYEITVNTKIEQPQTTLTTESFRNHIVPGTHEHWTLRLSIDGKPVANGAIISAITDKAINTLRDNKWNVFIRNICRTTHRAFSSPYRVSGINNYFEWNTSINRSISKIKVPSLSTPELNLYGNSFFASRMRIRGLSAEKSQDLMYLTNDTNAKESANAFVSEDNRPIITEEDNSLNDVTLRTETIKTALWQPLLMTDENGNACIEFDVPDMNTTWLFQAIAYDNAMNTATILRNIVANKPLMVSANLPRFVRHGDKITLMANVQNATDSAQSCHALIELFNPLNNNTFTSKSFNITIDKQSASPVSIFYEIPDSINVLGFRIKASNGTYADGEQNLIPVLPSESAIIESKPFYITPDTESFTIDLPTFSDNARVTFEYCDNPIWYIVTALPSISSEQQNVATSLAHALFAHLVAKKVANDYPAIHQALEYWKNNPQDSALMSMVALNQNLKIGSLLASPWIKESEAQTMRMSQLDNLFNSEKTNSTTDRLIEQLSELQQDNGGFVWYKYPNAKSSVFTTLYVMQIIGRIKSCGAIVNDSKLNNIISKAIKYIDDEFVKLYNSNPKINGEAFSEFVYTRSLFTDIEMQDNTNLTYNNTVNTKNTSNSIINTRDAYNNAINQLAKDWQNMNIANKAFTAIALANFGKKAQAMAILESINQFSIYKPETGRFWDNFQDASGRYHSKVSLTSLILQVYHKLSPQSIEIDQIRQWLLLEKQTSDWGNSSLASDAVFALLTTGSKWCNISKSPVIKLDNTPLKPSKIDSILGYMQLQLNINKSSQHSITIERNASNPSWGAIYNQYTAEMTDVKATSANELSIHKTTTNYNGKDSLEIGIKIQVRLTITSTKDLEYVTICDQRPACIEPVNQISGYQHNDGIWYYLETKDSNTNIFIDYLPKGTHIITYDAYVNNAGIFHCGVATIQCQYAPQITAHSSGSIISVK